MKNAKIERSYHCNGRLFQEVPFVRGKVKGVIREWHRNGTLSKEVPMKDGLRHGLCREWNEKGSSENSRWIWEREFRAIGFAQDGGFNVLFGVRIFETEEIEQVGVA